MNRTKTGNAGMPKVFQSKNHAERGTAKPNAATYFMPCGCGAENKKCRNKENAEMSKMQIMCAAAVMAAFGALLAWDRLTLERRMEEARETGRAEANAKAEAVGDWAAWTRRSVNAWCRANGLPDAYKGEGALDAYGKAVE